MKFSVAMCTYNGAPYLREQLDSIVAQTRQPDELIVCDDRSADGTPEVVREFAAGAPFPVRLHVNEENLGSTKNFEKAISLCGGEIIALADQDDVWLPEKLEKFADALASAPAAGLVFSDGEVVDEHLNPLGYTIWQCLRFGPPRQKAFREGAAFEMMLKELFVTGAAMAFRSRYKDLVLPLRYVKGCGPGRWNLIHDGWIALMIAAAAQLIPIDEPLIKYRQHSGQQLGIGPYPEAEPPSGTQAPNDWRARAAALHRSFFACEARRLSEIQERLAEKSGDFRCGAAVAMLGARIRHLRARAQVSDSKLRRLPLVLRELLTLRYFRYSNGAFSAAKDLLL